MDIINAVLWILTDFYADSDPDPAFYLNADPEPVSQQMRSMRIWIQIRILVKSVIFT